MSRVLLVQGGKSREREVSLKTGAAIGKALQSLGHDVSVFDPADSRWADICANKPDVAFLALHGSGGEDGTIQGFFETIGVSYTGSGVFASSLCIDKNATKAILRGSDVVMAKSILWHAGDAIPDLQNLGLKLPVVIKPSREGSTIGLAIVRDVAQLSGALTEAASFDKDVLIEEFIVGREMTVSVLNGKALPVVEIVPKSGFYDYKSKYTVGMTDYYSPARITAAESQILSQSAERAVQLTQCRGAPRVDFILGEDGRAYFLEINTIPGMTETSLLPKAAKAVGIDFAGLCAAILAEARLGS